MNDDAWLEPIPETPLQARIREAGDNLKALIYAQGLGDEEAATAIVNSLSPAETRDALIFASIALTPKASPTLEGPR